MNLATHERHAESHCQSDVTCCDNRENSGQIQEMSTAVVCRRGEHEAAYVRLMCFIVPDALAVQLSVIALLVNQRAGTKYFCIMIRENMMATMLSEDGDDAFDFTDHKERILELYD